jgi:DNA-directed RNA polymerase sigma subunit (sigma70/sigma32)
MGGDQQHKRRARRREPWGCALARLSTESEHPFHLDGSARKRLREVPFDTVHATELRADLLAGDGVLAELTDAELCCWFLRTGVKVLGRKPLSVAAVARQLHISAAKVKYATKRAVDKLEGRT